MIPLLGLLPFAEKLLDALDLSGEKKSEAKVKLLEMQQNGELAKLANDAELFKSEVADRDSARKRESEIAVAEKAPLINKIVTPLLALGVVAMTFALFGVVMFNSEAIEQSKKELVMFILGSLTSISSTVLSYYFGTSASSAQKNNVIASLSK